MTVKRLDGGPIEAKPLSPEMVAQAKEMITGSLGLVPFTDLSVVPEDADWSHVTGGSLEVAGGGTETYELTWLEESYGRPTEFRKWRGFVDPKTDLPQRTESYRKLARDVEYTLVSVKVIAYLGDDEMQAVIKGASF
jgi:hypothetical protein